MKTREALMEMSSLLVEYNGYKLIENTVHLPDKSELSRKTFTGRGEAVDFFVDQSGFWLICELFTLRTANYYIKQIQAFREKEDFEAVETEIRVLFRRLLHYLSGLDFQQNEAVEYLENIKTLAKRIEPVI